MRSHVGDLPEVDLSSGNYVEYVVEAGDSLSKIAEKLYKDSSQWKKLLAANKSLVLNPDAIYPGDVLKVPVDDAQSKESMASDIKSSSSHALGDAVTHTVSYGETLTSIAKSYMGDGSLWRLVWSQVATSVNNPNLIFPDQVLEFKTLASSAAASGQTMMGE